MRQLIAHAAEWLSTAEDVDEHRTGLLRSIAPAVAAAAEQATEVPFESAVPLVVADHLSMAATATPGGSTATAAFAAEVGRVGTELHWVESYRELPRGDAVIDRFRDNYAYCVLGHPGHDRWGPAPFRTSDFALGFTLQGPDIFYPAHSHAAIELYGVIGGSGEWQRGDGDWEMRCAGSSLAHTPHESHAMRTGVDPMLSCFVWISDLDCTVTMH